MLEQSLARWEITCSQFRLLNVLSLSQERLRPKDLADQLDIDMAASTRLLDRLEKKGMIKRIKCTEDRRVCFILLDKNFQAEFSKIKGHQQRVEEAFLTSLLPKNRKLLKSLINELSKIKKYRSGETGQSVIF